MTNEEEKEKATAIVVEILQLLSGKNLTMVGAERILCAAARTLSEKMPYAMPENTEWFQHPTEPYLPVFVKTTEP